MYTLTIPSHLAHQVHLTHSYQETIMSAHPQAKGSCICGEVNFSVKEISRNIGACHCNTCRKWGGGPLLAIDCGTKVSFEGKDNIAVYNSSEWAERAFCKECGSHLFYRLKGTGQYIMPAGLIDSDIEFNFDHQVFIDEQPAYYCFSNKTSDMTGPEVFSKFAPPEQ